MSTFEQLLSIIHLQDFPHKTELLDALGAGQSTLEIDTGHAATDTTSELLRIYKRRYEHLIKITSAHAQALASDIAWFCSNLEARPLRQYAVWIVKLAYPYHLNIWIDAETQSVVGCLKAVSQLDVSPAEWETLWRTR